MSKITNVILESNNLDFLNSITKDKYPTAVLFREHFKKHSAIESLSELLELETIIHGFKVTKSIRDYSTTTWLLRSSILMILEYSSKAEDDRDIIHLENCISAIGEDALSNAQRIERLVYELREDQKAKIEEYTISLSLVNICLDLRQINLKKPKLV